MESTLAIEPKPTSPPEEPSEAPQIGHGIEARIGPLHVRQRLGLQDEYIDRWFGKGRTPFHIENWKVVEWMLERGLRMTRLREQARRNFLNVVVERHEVEVPRLPAAFNGFRILHLADLHIDLNPRLANVLIHRIRDLDYDLCLITGDFRAHTYGPYHETLRLTERVISGLGTACYGVLGNHDVLEMVQPLEALGIRMLLNESAVLRRGSAAIHLCGVDDPHYFQLDNLEKAMAQIPPSGFTLLLSHSPELYRHAAHAGVDLMLCGHTHGGQICFPGGRPIIKNTRCPRALISGSWRWRGLQGYTSRGAGASLLDARFWCPPEITIHHLRVPRAG